MEMAENTKLDSSSSGLEEDNKVSNSDHINGFQYKKSDSFVIDVDSFSGPIKDINANSRITLQRSLSRKGSQRGGAVHVAAAAEKKINSNTNERDIIASTSSPRGHASPEKQSVVGGGVGVGTATVDHSGGPQVHHHQITITTGNMSSTPQESRCFMKRNSFKRSSLWVVDPKRVLLFFATLSSMGTILLIYFTLSIGKYRADENSLD